VNELVNLVAQKVGISADQARTAVDTVLGFLKNKLPAPLAGQLDNVAAGGAAEGAEDGILDKIKKGVGSLVGSK
jgi:hypothetical protein